MGERQAVVWKCDLGTGWIWDGEREGVGSGVANTLVPSSNERRDFEDLTEPFCASVS